MTKQIFVFHVIPVAPHDHVQLSSCLDADLFSFLFWIHAPVFHDRNTSRFWFLNVTLVKVISSEKLFTFWLNRGSK